MNYLLIRQLLSLAESFENETAKGEYPPNVDGFTSWLTGSAGNHNRNAPDISWEGKNSGRSPESVIATLIVHMNRYAKTYSRSAIHGSDFSTQDEFSYLINLQAAGAMNKMQLIKKNIHDKPTGMQIISRLVEKGWVRQSVSKADRRSKLIEISESGRKALQTQMPKIKQATRIVSGDLTAAEKIQLIGLLTKLEQFHQPIFQQNIPGETLLNTVSTQYRVGA